MRKPATDATRKANAAVLNKLPFGKDNSVNEEIRRGLIEEVPDLIIKDEDGTTIWDSKAFYDFITKSEQAPDTVNPSLWRHQRLECVSGLFEVTDGIWQVRGFDISNITIIRSNRGYILVDPLNTPETARAAMKLFFEHFPKKPITGVIITHTHGDHYGGIDGAVPADELANIPIVVPEGFTNHTIIERVFVGRAMMRRVPYQFGQKLPRSPQGTVGAGLGITSARTKTNFVMPTIEINKTGEKLNIDGVEFVFEMAPETEAPAEFCFYLPQFKTLCMGELINPHLHNLLPIRGAQVRSAKQWAYYIQEALALFGDQAEVLVNTHHWPIWGNKNIVNYLKKQRDLYKFLNDQTVRRINQGQTMVEIAEELELPESLDQDWASRGYYGHLNHNVKATYQKYLGWFDCNPSTLNALPPEKAGKAYVDLMGGPDETLKKAKEIFDRGEYRLAAMVLNDLVFGYPNNKDAKELLADTYEQLGYQAESATWRNCYLTGAEELRNGAGPVNTKLHMNETALLNMPTDYVLDYLATRVDPQKAKDKETTILLNFTDKGEKVTCILENSTINAWMDKLPGAQAEYSMTRKTFDELVRDILTVEDAIKQGKITQTGKQGQLELIFDSLEETPNFNFGIVTP